MAGNQHQQDKMAVYNSVDHKSDNPGTNEMGREESEQIFIKPLQKIKAVESQPRKKSSFQITGVVPAKSGLDHVNEDLDTYSLDDLDETCETHTEDVSSDILDLSKNTDIEPDPSSSEDTTPSMMMDDIAKEFPNKPHPLPSVESHPKDEVDNEVVPNEDAPPAAVQPVVEAAEGQSRFKVVKIESKEPFKRGRWFCHDFADQQTEKQDKDEVGSGNSSASSSIHYVHGVDDPSKNPLAGATMVSADHQIIEPQPMYPESFTGHLKNGGDYAAPISVPTSTPYVDQNVQVVSQTGTTTGVSNLTSGALVPVSEAKMISSANQPFVTHPTGAFESIPNQQISIPNQQSINSQLVSNQTGQVPASLNTATGGNTMQTQVPQNGVPPQVSISNSELQQPTSNVPQHSTVNVQTPSTVPLHMQGGQGGVHHSDHLPNINGEISKVQSANTSQGQTSLSQADYVAQSQGQQEYSQSNQEYSASQGMPQSNKPQGEFVQLSTQPGHDTVHIEHPQSNISQQNQVQPNAGSAIQRDAAEYSSQQHTSAAGNLSTVQSSGGSEGVGQSGQSLPMTSGGATNKDPSPSCENTAATEISNQERTYTDQEILQAKLESVHLKNDNGQEEDDNSTPKSSMFSLNQAFLTPPLLEMVTATMQPGSSTSQDGDERCLLNVFSGASTVAIDNKIEQAMDLVKSHLMFAVREEVEVLKEQIKELLEKNNQLEYENSILKANASQETLSQIKSSQLQRQPDNTQPPTSSS